MDLPTEPADSRVTWGLVCDLLDVLERHGYHKGDDQHTGRAIGCMGALGRLYAGEQDELAPAEATAS